MRSSTLLQRVWFLCLLCLLFSDFNPLSLSIAAAEKLQLENDHNVTRSSAKVRFLASNQNNEASADPAAREAALQKPPEAIRREASVATAFKASTWKRNSQLSPFPERRESPQSLQNGLPTRAVPRDLLLRLEQHETVGMPSNDVSRSPDSELDVHGIGDSKSPNRPGDTYTDDDAARRVHSEQQTAPGILIGSEADRAPDVPTSSPERRAHRLSSAANQRDYQRTRDKEIGTSDMPRTSAAATNAERDPSAAPIERAMPTTGVRPPDALVTTTPLPDGVASAQARVERGYIGEPQQVTSTVDGRTATVDIGQSHAHAPQAHRDAPENAWMKDKDIADQPSVPSTAAAAAAVGAPEPATQTLLGPRASTVPVLQSREHPYSEPLPSATLSVEALLSLLGWHLNGHQVERLTQQASDGRDANDHRQLALYALQVVKEALHLDAQLRELIPHTSRAPILDDWWPALKERTTVEILQLTTQLQWYRMQLESSPRPLVSDSGWWQNPRPFRHQLDALSGEINASFEAMMILLERGEQHLFALATPDGLSLIELRPLKEQITRWREQMLRQGEALQQRLRMTEQTTSPVPNATRTVLETQAPAVTAEATIFDHESDPGLETSHPVTARTADVSRSASPTQPLTWVSEVEHWWRTSANATHLQEILGAAAETGDTIASITLARLLWSGDSGRHLQPNRSRAWHYLKQAIDAGQPDAHDLVATIMLLNGTEPSLPQALLHFHRAAADGHAHAQMVLGFRYLFGLGGLAENCAQAVHLYRQAAAHAVQDLSPGETTRNEPLSMPPFASRAAESELDLLREIRPRALPLRRALPLEMFRLSATDAKRIRRFAKQWRRSSASATGHAVSTDSSSVGVGKSPESLTTAFLPDWLDSMRASAVTGLSIPMETLDTIIPSSAASSAWSRTSTQGSLTPDADTFGDERELVQYYRHAAERGDVRAQVAMGQVLLQGAPGLAPNYRQALQYLTRAAQAGDPQAHAHLAFMYSQGLGVTPNNQTALWHYRIAAARREPNALNALGHLYLWGIGVDRDGQEAARLFRAAAAQGHAEAKYNLGVLYLNGIGVERRDQREALTYFVEAARAGHRRAAWKAALLMQAGITQSACIDIALSFRRVAEDGRMVRTPLERARWLLEQSGLVSRRLSGASRRMPPAQVAAMLDEALWRTVQAALAGVEVAQYNAAVLYASWVQDEHQALHYWLLASLNGHRQAMLEAGDLLYRWQEQRGESSSSFSWLWSVADRQRVSAVECYRQAAELGTAEALFNLGYLHMRGRGGAVLDLHLAERYLEAARALDAKEAWLAVTLTLWWIRLAQARQRLLLWYHWQRTGRSHDRSLAWQPYRPRLAMTLLGFLCFALVTKWFIRRHLRAHHHHSGQAASAVDHLHRD
jgi:SEL1 protein